MAPQAASSLKLTASDLLALGIVDKIIPEPGDGAHSDWDASAKLLEQALVESWQPIEGLSVDQLLKRRYEKFRKMGMVERA